MAGYLDADFQGGLTGFRQVIQRVLATLEATDRRIYSFGSRVAAVTAPSNQDVIRTLVRQDFYTDDDTRLEDVLDSVAADGARQALHLIVTDGRRGSGDAAIAQYQRLGALAKQWANGQGTLFATAAIDAPFAPVRRDKAGCWSKGGDADVLCPLYIFLFAPRSAAEEVLDRLRETGARIHVAPTFSDANVQAAYSSATPAQPGNTLRTQGGTRKTPLHLFFETSSPQGRADGTVAVDVGVSAGRFALDDSLSVRTTSVGLTPSGRGPAGAWAEVRDPSKSWVRPGGVTVDREQLRARIPLTLVTNPRISPTRYRLELVSTGWPGWLADFEAPGQGHATKTYGLSALFDQLPRRVTPIAAVVATVYPSLP